MSINLSKNQSINLSKEAGGNLRKIRLGLGWDQAEPQGKGGFFGRMKKTGGDIDLDASAILFDGSRIAETVYFGKLTGGNGAVQHTGDNLTGAGDGDDESIIVDLQALPSNITSIVFSVNSYSGQKFTTISNSFVRVVDTLSNDREIARYTLSEGGDYTAVIMGVLSRSGDEWTFRSVGKFGNGRTAQQVGSLASAAL